MHLLIFIASFMCFPFNSSVANDEDAMAEPKVLNLKFTQQLGIL